MVLAGIAGVDPGTTAVHPYLVLDEASREPAPTEGGAVLEGGAPRRSCAALFGRATTRGPSDAGEDAAITDASADRGAPSIADSSVLDAPSANEGGAVAADAGGPVPGVLSLPLIPAGTLALNQSYLAVATGCASSASGALPRDAGPGQEGGQDQDAGPDAGQGGVAGDAKRACGDSEPSLVLVRLSRRMVSGHRNSGGARERGHPRSFGAFGGRANDEHAGVVQQARTLANRAPFRALCGCELGVWGEPSGDRRAGRACDRRGLPHLHGDPRSSVDTESLHDRRSRGQPDLRAARERARRTSATARGALSRW